MTGISPSTLPDEAATAGPVADVWGTRILIAEDESIIRLDLRQTLERAGFEVCAETENGEDAVRLAREAKPQAALLDVRMPRLNGIEAARRILAERPIPIVMLTAYADPATFREAVAAGVFAYVVKPFREQDLLPALATAIARHGEWLRSRRELGRLPAQESRPLDIVIGSGNWPLRVERRPDGTLDVRPLSEEEADR
ncbi:MAG: response regulator [Gaiellaceae bacterium]